MILSNVFLKMHYSSDTYVLIDLGYMEYPKKWFLLDGRIISSIFCYIAGFFKIPYDVYIIGMDFFAILFLSFSIFVIFLHIYFFVILSFVFNSSMILINTKDHIKAYEKDKEIGNFIKNEILSYELNNGIKVKNISYCFNKYQNFYAYGIKEKGSLTECKFFCKWSIIEAINFYCGRKFELKKEYPQVLKGLQYKKYKEFSDRQFFIYDDTAYIIVQNFNNSYDFIK